MAQRNDAEQRRRAHGYHRTLRHHFLKGHPRKKEKKEIKKSAKNRRALDRDNT